MTIEELLVALKNIVDSGEFDEDGGFDKEGGHDEADGLLLKYINDQRITDAFDNIPKWYS